MTSDVRGAAAAAVKTWSDQAGRVFESMGSDNPRAIFIDEAMDALEAALATPPDDGWVRVTPETMPEDYIEVLVTDGDKIAQGWHRPDMNPKWVIGRSALNGPITHWRKMLPLPEPSRQS